MNTQYLSSHQKAYRENKNPESWFSPRVSERLEVLAGVMEENFSDIESIEAEQNITIKGWNHQPKEI
ncbi:MAG TPA: hypothetical protein VK469_16710 [Candidatus Kapabacteria bacterium]|nr:hypothetical protein [Candidatus Kapabacteria bacterium]